MNLWHLSASDLLVWGIFLHLIADWPLQNDWMAKHKANLLHPAGYVHAGIHAILLTTIFGWVAVPLGILHLLIDTRKPIVWWSTKVIQQTQPTGAVLYQHKETEIGYDEIPIVDVGLEVRFWTDQVFHIACIAVAALLVTL